VVGLFPWAIRHPSNTSGKPGHLIRLCTRTSFVFIFKGDRPPLTRSTLLPNNG